MVGRIEDVLYSVLSSTPLLHSSVSKGFGGDEFIEVYTDTE
jgi:hypothetical protein